MAGEKAHSDCIVSAASGKENTKKTSSFLPSQSGAVMEKNEKVIEKII